MTKVIDYLSEDQEISGQKYALISIVGPHLPQKCDVWGLKIRGIVDSVADAKQLTKKLMKFDNMYDIYTVSVGKFFPLNVEPYDIKEVEHDEERLNNLMKNYLKNREDSNEHYQQRKQTMMEKAIQEGSKESQSELASKVEHPISVLQRKQKFEEKAIELKQQLESLEKDLELTCTKYSTYTDEQRLEAETTQRFSETQVEIKTEEKSNTDTDTDLSNIKYEIMTELKEEEENEESNQDKTEQGPRSSHDELFQ